MGMRIHKALGYGLEGFQKPEGWDDLLETDSRSFRDWCSNNFLDISMLAEKHLKTVQWTRHSFESYLIAFRWDLIPSEFIKYHSVSELVATEPYNKNVLLLTPPGLPDWKRRDSAIDFYEYHLNGDPPLVRKVNRELYPYDKGAPPIILAGVCMFLGIPEVYAKLEEMILHYWA